MASQPRPQTPFPQLSSADLSGEPQAYLARNHHSRNISELQRRLKAVVQRLVGKDARSCPGSSSLSLPPSPSHSSPLSYFSFSPFLSSYSSSPQSLEDSSPDEDTISNYDDSSFDDEEEEEEEELPALDPDTADADETSPISSPCSYTSIASSNPYTLDAEDLAHRLALVSLSETARRAALYGEQVARLAQQLETAHAVVVAAEGAALRDLRARTRLD